MPLVALRAARSRRIAISARTRPSLRVRLALMPCRSHAFPDGQFLVEFLLLHRLVRQPLVFLADVGGVVSRPRRQLATIEIDDACGQPRQERAVVGDEHDRACVVAEEALEPRNRIDVEMVGRLVEQQQIRLANQGLREQRAAAPASRQRIHDPIGGETESLEYELDTLFESPAAPLLEFVL